jgi:tetratricopeptide (TPR) repeat protein
MAFTLAISLPLATLPAVAAEENAAQRVEHLAADAATAYRSADYSRAVELLERAYSIRQIAALLYNLAKAYEKLGNQEKAIDLYRRYSDSTDADPKLRMKAEARVAAYEEARTHATTGPERPRGPEQGGVPPTAGQVTPNALDHAAHVDTPEERAIRAWKSRRAHDRIIGLSLGSFGVGAAIVGAGLSGAAFAGHEQYTNSIGPEFPRRALRDRAHDEAVASDVLYGVAIAAAGVGAYFLWRGYHRERPPGTKLMVAPTMVGQGNVPRGGGLALGAQF